MPTAEVLDTARAAYARRAWRDAYEALQPASQDGDLAREDLERLATAAYLTGRSDDAVAAMERLHHCLHGEGDEPGAIRWAVWLAIVHFLKGQHAQGGGWVARAQRLLEAADGDGPAQGYVLSPTALQALEGGDPDTAHARFEQVAAIGKEFDDPDLIAVGLLGRGRALIAAGDAERGVAMLDEAMVMVTTGDVFPILAGIVYCAVIISCRAVFDLQRAQEWTGVLSRWCDSQQDLKPYRGQCLVHRSEIMQFQGNWTRAMEEVEAACSHLAETPGDPVMGMAQYQLAELLRLRGDLEGAEVAYRESDDWGHPSQPGLALLRLAQGRVDDAAAAIRRSVDEHEDDRVQRSRVLAAYVEILLAAGDEAAAAAGVDELGAIAAEFDSPYLEAAAAQAQGAVLLANGDAAGALVALRAARRQWQVLHAPYEAARVRLLIARALRALDDHDAAELELEAARGVFEQLGAVPALGEAAALVRAPRADAPGGLTPREVEVLRLVATGATNREVADDLVISEKTVARHLSNIFTKLGLSSRAAATAWAYEHDLA